MLKRLKTAIKKFRGQWRERQNGLNGGIMKMVDYQNSDKMYLSQDITSIELAFKERLNLLKDRYGPRIAYIQSLPIVENGDRVYSNFNNNIWSALDKNPMLKQKRQFAKGICPILDIPDD